MNCNFGCNLGATGVSGCFIVVSVIGSKVAQQPKPDYMTRIGRVLKCQLVIGQLAMQMCQQTYRSHGSSTGFVCDFCCSQLSITV